MSSPSKHHIFKRLTNKISKGNQPAKPSCESSISNTRPSLQMECETTTSRYGIASTSYETNVPRQSIPSERESSSYNPVPSTSKSYSSTTRRRITKTQNSKKKCSLKEHIFPKPTVRFNCNVQDFSALVFRAKDETGYIILIIRELLNVTLNNESTLQAALNALTRNREILTELIATPQGEEELSNLSDSGHVLLDSLCKLIDFRACCEIRPIIASTIKFIVAVVDSYVNHLQILILMLTSAKLKKSWRGTVSYFPLQEPPDLSSSHNLLNRVKRYRHKVSHAAYQANKRKCNLRKLVKRRPTSRLKRQNPKYKRAEIVPNGSHDSFFDNSSDE